jgi:hypothetical protein
MIIEHGRLDELEIELVKCRRCNARAVIEKTDAIIVDEACHGYHVHCSNDKCPTLTDGAFSCGVSAEECEDIRLIRERQVLEQLSIRWNAKNFDLAQWWISVVLPDFSASLSDEQINHLTKKYRQLESVYFKNGWGKREDN